MLDQLIFIMVGWAVLVSLGALWFAYLFGAALMIRAMNNLDYNNPLTRSYHMIFGATLFTIACFCVYIIGRNQ